MKWTALIRCPDCGEEHTGAPGDLPEFCNCGTRFWGPVPTSSAPAQSFIERLGQDWVTPESGDGPDH